MTCKQLGGACDLIFKAETFEEIAALSRAHAQKMMQQKDKAQCRQHSEPKRPDTSENCVKWNTFRDAFDNENVNHEVFLDSLVLRMKLRREK